VEIYCCGCEMDVNARLTFGREVYGHRIDLHNLAFWKCDGCGNSVGCHNGSRDPLGCIATREIKVARRHIHEILDPIWVGVKRRRTKRSELYKRITDHIGREYHTADIRSIDEARDIYRFVKTLVAG